MGASSLQYKANLEFLSGLLLILLSKHRNWILSGWCTVRVKYTVPVWWVNILLACGMLAYGAEAFMALVLCAILLKDVFFVSEFSLSVTYNIVYTFQLTKFYSNSNRPTHELRLTMKKLFVLLGISYLLKCDTCVAFKGVYWHLL